MKHRFDSSASSKALAEETGHREGREYVLQVVDLCTMAGCAELAGDFIRQGLMPAAVRNELLSRGSHGGASARAGSGSKNLEQNPMVKRATKLASDVDKNRIN